MEQLLKDCQAKMSYSLEHLRGELAKLRTGQASLAILEGIKVDFYGTPTPLSQTSTLGVPDSSTLTIQPWDVSILKDIEKALQASELGLTPNNDGKMIRLQIPPPSPRKDGNSWQRWLKSTVKNAGWRSAISAGSSMTKSRRVRKTTKSPKTRVINTPIKCRKSRIAKSGRWTKRFRKKKKMFWRLDKFFSAVPAGKRSAQGSMNPVLPTTRFRPVDRGGLL